MIIGYPSNLVGWAWTLFTPSIKLRIYIGPIVQQSQFHTPAFLNYNDMHLIKLFDSNGRE